MWVNSMEKIKLIEPTIKYEKDIWDFRQLSYGRCKTMKSFNALYDGLKSLK